MPNPNRILFVSNTAWNLHNFRLPLMKSLKRAGFEVYAAGTEDKFSRVLIKEGFPFFPWRVDRKSVNLFKEIGFFFDLLWLYKKLRPAVIFHYTIKPNIYGTIAACLTGAKTIDTITGLGYTFMQKNLLSFFTKMLYKFSLHFADKIVFQNEDDRKLFLDLKLIRFEQTEVIRGSGVDISHFRISGRKARTGRLVFMLISRLLADKGIREYIEAARLLKEEKVKADFFLAGPVDTGNPSSISREEVRQWERNGTVRYMGSSDDVRKFLDACDVVVLPSYREGSPRILLEAAASGKPLVTTDVPGCRDVVVEDKNGFLVKPGDAVSLTAAMKRMTLLTAKRRLDMGRFSRQRIKILFEIGTVIDGYTRIVNDLICKK